MLQSCKECGAPQVVTGETLWLNNGDIVQKRDQRHRLILIESDNLDLLFSGIEEIIGTSIQHVVIGCVRKSLRTYMKLFISEEVREKVHKKELDLKLMDDGFRELAKPMGFGRYEFVDMRYEGSGDDYFTVSITDPYSLPMCVAGHTAAMEAILDYDHAANYSEVSPHFYHINAFPQPHPEEFKGRLAMKLYEHRDGDLVVEACGTCGGPKALTGYKWHLDRGIIMNTYNKRRMAMMSPSELDPIFLELEAELGDAIPRVVVEAQRRFTRTGFYSIDDVVDEGDYRNQLALRGLGNLKELSVRRKGVQMRLENAAIPLMIVGMMQGVFELAFDIDSRTDWEYAEDGTLDIEISPLNQSRNGAGSSIFGRK